MNNTNSKPKRNWPKIIGISFGCLFGLAVIAHIVDPDDTMQKADAEDRKESVASIEEQPRVANIGDVLKTEYFDVTVSKVSVDKSVNTGNEFTDLKAEQGINYLTLTVQVKNTDKETRMMFDGEIIAIQNNTRLKYEQPEPVLAEGYGMILENINPGITKRTKLVYKIPDDLQATLYCHPARSANGEMIFLGHVSRENKK